MYVDIPSSLPPLWLLIRQQHVSIKYPRAALHDHRLDTSASKHNNSNSMCLGLSAY